MSERGVFAIDRGLFDHERFTDEPFTEREAWMWMIGQAAFKPYRKRVGSIVVNLQRGQMAHSLRFMAEKWKWAEPRVRRFLSKLKGCPPKSDALIDARTDAGVTVISICKYDAYQDLLRPRDAPTDAAIDAPPTQRRIYGSDSGSGCGGGYAHAREDANGSKVTPEAWAFASELAKIAGHDPEFLPPKWVSDRPGERVQMMLNSGWLIPVMRDNAIAAMRRKRDGAPHSVKYFEPIFARAHAPQLPLPAAQLVGRNDHGPRPDGSGYTGDIDTRSFATISASLRAKGDHAA